MGGNLRDCDDGNTYTLHERPAGSVGADYEDITLQIEAEMLEAERLAKPHDFGNVPGRGMSVPGDFLERLRGIWLANQQS